MINRYLLNNNSKFIIKQIYFKYSGTNNKNLGITILFYIFKYFLRLISLFNRHRTVALEDRIAFELFTDKTTRNVYLPIVEYLSKDFVFLNLSSKYFKDYYTRFTKKEFKQKIHTNNIYNLCDTLCNQKIKDSIDLLSLTELGRLNSIDKLKILVKIIYWESYVQKAKFRIFITHNDTNSCPIRHLVFNAYSIKMIHIQNGEREPRREKTYNSYDYLLTFSSEQLKYYSDDLSSFIANHVIYGSFLLNKKLVELTNKNQTIDFDICFIEQITDKDYPLSFIQNDYLNLLNNMVLFSNKFPRYKICYVARNNTRQNPQKCLTFIRQIDTILQNSNIKILSEDIYDTMSKSTIIVGYNSTALIEAIGLSKKILVCNYSKFNYSYLTHFETEYVLVEDNYKVFEKKIISILNKNDYSKVLEILQNNFMYPNLKYLENLKEIVDEI